MIEFFQGHCQTIQSSQTRVQLRRLWKLIAQRHKARWVYLFFFFKSNQKCVDVIINFSTLLMCIKAVHYSSTTLYYNTPLMPTKHYVTIVHYGFTLELYWPVQSTSVLPTTNFITAPVKLSTSKTWTRNLCCLKRFLTSFNWI